MTDMDMTYYSSDIFRWSHLASHLALVHTSIHAHADGIQFVLQAHFPLTHDHGSEQSLCLLHLAPQQWPGHSHPGVAVGAGGSSIVPMPGVCSCGSRALSVDGSSAHTPEMHAHGSLQSLLELHDAPAQWPAHAHVVTTAAAVDVLVLVDGSSAQTPEMQAHGSEQSLLELHVAPAQWPAHAQLVVAVAALMVEVLRVVDVVMVLVEGSSAQMPEMQAHGSEQSLLELQVAPAQWPAQAQLVVEAVEEVVLLVVDVLVVDVLVVFVEVEVVVVLVVEVEVEEEAAVVPPPMRWISWLPSDSMEDSKVA